MSDVDDCLTRLFTGIRPESRDIISLLALEEGTQAEELFRFADQVRSSCCGDGILVRGIIEFSNICRNTCAYCGLQKNNLNLQRYRLTSEEFLRSIQDIAAVHIKTVVIQSGEHDEADDGWLSEMVSEIKKRYGLAITLSVGERSGKVYRQWRMSGADRYLLKIETSDKHLYESLHPGMSFENRLRCLDDLRTSGYQVGSGSIIGLPGQTKEIIARDIAFFKERSFDMIGIGPFIPHRGTRLGAEHRGDAFLTIKALALTRIVTHNTHIPATTALGSLREDYRLWALKAGANVLMPNFTPLEYRRLYEIYPGKRCLREPSGASSSYETMAASVGRFIDYSRGDALKNGPSLTADGFL
jgi:biotin synthase